MVQTADTDSVWQLLSAITIGKLVAWIVVICAIIAVFCTGTVKLYKAFTKYKDMKDKKENLEKTVDSHEKEIDELGKQIKEVDENLSGQLQDIKQILEVWKKEQRETKIKELRHQIVSSGEKALKDGQMTIREWSSLHEMFDEYTNKYHQNHYVPTLIKKVDEDVKIIGELEDDKEDNNEC